MATSEVLLPAMDSANPNAVSKREKAEALLAKYEIDSDDIDLNAYNDPERMRERVFKSIRVRVRYTCHKCQTSFGKNASCGGCQHKRCRQCTRYPLKKDKSKMAPPQMMEEMKVDERKPSVSGQDPVCHECQTDLDVSVEECPNCQHKICDRCQRETMVSPPASSEESKGGDMEKSSTTAAAS